MASIRVQICKSHRPNVLAGASITIELDGGGSIEINDCRLLRNKSGILWASLPTYSVQIGRGYEYRATIVLSPALHQEVTAAILKAYEAAQGQALGAISPKALNSGYREMGESVTLIVRRTNLELIRCSDSKLTLDCAFHFNGIAAAYCLSPQESEGSVSLLKLRGSLNWSRCEKCGVISATQFDQLLARQNLPYGGSGEIELSLSTCLPQCASCGVASTPEPLIIPPTWNKRNTMRRSGMSGQSRLAISQKQRTSWSSDILCPQQITFSIIFTRSVQ